MYSNCLEWNLSKEQMVINLFALQLFMVCLYLILLYRYTINNDYIHGIIFTVPSFLDARISTCVFVKFNLPLYITSLMILNSLLWEIELSAIKLRLQSDSESC